MVDNEETSHKMDASMLKSQISLSQQEITDLEAQVNSNQS